MFASDDVYWAKPLPPSIMAITLQNSLCFALFELSNPQLTTNSSLTTSTSEPVSTPTTSNKFIGLARCITDFATFLYLTDVHILPAHQGSGLGKWLISCIHEVISSMPHLRRAMLFTSDWRRSVPFYEKELGMSVMEMGKRGEGVAVMTMMGPGVAGLVIGKDCKE